MVSFRLLLWFALGLRFRCDGRRSLRSFGPHRGDCRCFSDGRFFRAAVLDVFFLGLVARLFSGPGLVSRTFEAVQTAQLDGHVFIDRAGVRLLFGDAQFGKAVQDFVSLDLQLPCQLVNANLLHRQSDLLTLRWHSD
jgi:hypothetical protein